MTTKTDKRRFGRLDLVILGIILLVALLLRLYKINTPLADWHSWRQVDTASVARNFVNNGFDLTHPRFHDLSNIPSGKDNPQGYRFVEFPLYNSTFAALFKAAPILPLEVYGRLVTVFFSLILITMIYYLAHIIEGRIAAIFASAFFATMPFFVYYSRVVLPEMMAISLMFGSVVTLFHWSRLKDGQRQAWIWYGASLILAALALLVKPTVIFYYLVLVLLYHSRFGLRMFEKISVYLYFVLALLPFLWWRFYILQFPEGIPVSEWLLTSVQTSEGVKTIFFRPAFFRWVFFERINQLILGGFGLVIVFFGLLKKKQSFFAPVVGLSALIYLFTFQGGNVQHDYYQVMILPAIALFAGMGAAVLFESHAILPNRLLNISTLCLILVFAWSFSFYRVKDYYNFSPQLLSVANVIQTLTPEDSLIATDRVGDSTLLYLAKRRGFPALTDDPETLKQKGIQYVVTSNPPEAEKLKKDYQLLFENEEMFLFKL